jgi:5-methyltetrahydrofolate--homocysteine methyltransferase
MRTELHSRRQTVVIGPEQPFVIIGERINPSGRKKLGAQMARGDFSAARKDAAAQVAAGAAVLDVNAGYAMGDEAAMLQQAVRAVQETVDVPQSLDSSCTEALEAALSVYQGKALVNCVTGEERRLNAVLGLARKYRAAVIGMLCDETGIPAYPWQRLAVGRKIIARAADYGITPQDVVLDPICLAVAADSSSAPVTLETIRLVHGELGVNLCCGAGNVSYGLPNRAAISAAFLTMAVSYGLPSAIADVMQPLIREAALAAGLLCGRDEYARRWLAYYREKQRPPAELSAAP